MSYELCQKVRDLEPYEPISGSYAVRLDANESFCSMPEELMEEFRQVLSAAAFNRYPDPCASGLIKAFASFYRLDPDCVTATNGSDEMLYLLASALLPRGSRVAVVDPDFSMYAFYSYLSENEILTFRKGEDQTLSVEALLTFVREQKADMLIFSNPCNPDSTGITAEEARTLVRQADCLVVIDEAYMDFWDQSILSEHRQYDNLILLKTASKAVGAAALRLGFAVASPEITRALRAVKSPYNVNSLSQALGEKLYSRPEWLLSCREAIIRQTRELYGSLQKLIENYQLPWRMEEPKTNFVFVRTEQAEDIYSFLLGENIAVRCFAKAKALRITSGTPQEQQKLMVALEKYVLEKIIKRNR